MKLDELIGSIDIVEYISQYVDLTQRGNEWWGLSCFKEEKTPSFSVRKNPPFFYDYSSGIGGNLYTFIKAYNKCSNKEAVDIIKKYAGYDGEMDIRSGKMSATLDCARYKKPVKQTKQSKTEILPNNYMEKYEKRKDKLAVWESEGISKESLDKFQVYYDAFSNRLVYPVRDVNGNIVNIGGRSVDPEWKEKGLSKYIYFFPWGTVDTIYGLAENREWIEERGEIILFEGCKSVLIADTWGLHNCGAILTSHLNMNQMKILAQLGCRVVFALDKEVDIRKDKHISILKNYVNVEYLVDRQDLLDEKDSPVDKGKEVFKKLYHARTKYR